MTWKFAQVHIIIEYLNITIGQYKYIEVGINFIFILNYFKLFSLEIITQSVCYAHATNIQNVVAPVFVFPVL